MYVLTAANDSTDIILDSNNSMDNIDKEKIEKRQKRSCYTKNYTFKTFQTFNKLFFRSKNSKKH